LAALGQHAPIFSSFSADIDGCQQTTTNRSKMKRVGVQIINTVTITEGILRRSNPASTKNHQGSHQEQIQENGKLEIFWT